MAFVFHMCCRAIGIGLQDLRFDRKKVIINALWKGKGEKFRED